MSDTEGTALQTQLKSTFVTLDTFYEHLPDRYQELFYQPLSSFPLKKLPIELRFMIWRLSIPQRRKIWLHPRKAKHGRAPAPQNFSILPATQVCIESRREIYKYLKVILRSRTPICITEFDIIRCGFNFLLRVDARYEEFLHLIGRRGQLVSQVRELEIKVDSFNHIDELFLILSGDLVFEPFVRLEKLKLLVPAGVDWKGRCEKRFEKVCRGYWTSISMMKQPVLAIEEC